MNHELPTFEFELSSVVANKTGETLYFVLREEKVTDALKDESLESLLSWMKPWQATFKDSAEVWTIYAGPYIEKNEILPLLENCKTLERLA